MHGSQNGALICDPAPLNGEKKIERKGKSNTSQIDVICPLPCVGHVDRWHHPWESAKRAVCQRKNKGGGVSPVPHSLEQLRLFDRRDISTKASASAGAA